MNESGQVPEVVIENDASEWQHLYKMRLEVSDLVDYHVFDDCDGTRWYIGTFDLVDEGSRPTLVLDRTWLNFRTTSVISQPQTNISSH